MEYQTQRINPSCNEILLLLHLYYALSDGFH
jgi:hypothetical protein